MIAEKDQLQNVLTTVFVSAAVNGVVFPLTGAIALDFQNGAENQRSEL